MLVSRNMILIPGLIMNNTEDAFTEHKIKNRIIYS